MSAYGLEFGLIWFQDAASKCLEKNKQNIKQTHKE